VLLLLSAAALLPLAVAVFGGSRAALPVCWLMSLDEDMGRRRRRRRRRSEVRLVDYLMKGGE
jgi:hypothetical protein